MHVLHRRKTLIVPFAFLLAIVTLGAPALSALHTLEHVAPAAASSGGEPSEAPENGELCDFCLSLSQTRSALAPLDLLTEGHAPLEAPIAALELRAVPSRVPHALASPRAPPLG